MKKEMNKKAQLSVFAILAIVIVIGVLAYFLFNKDSIFKTPEISNPENYVSDCLQEELENLNEKIIENSGSLEMSENFVQYKKDEIPFLCYAEKKFELCVNNRPMMAQEEENEIKEELKEKIEGCFKTLKRGLKADSFKESPLVYNVDIVPSKIKLNINKEITYTQEELVKKYSEFEVSINSPLYDFFRIANEIINEELNCTCQKTTCNANNLELERKNRGFTIRKDIINDNEEIYIIKEINSGKEFKFAIRNCVIVY